MPAVKVADEILTVAPELIDVLDRFMSLPDVLTEPSMMIVPPDVTSRNHVAVPLASAAALVMLFSVSTPPDAAGANVPLQVSSASFT